VSINPLVSVVIINFNSDKYIWRCLEALENQDYKNIEIFVIDNNSNDGSSEKLLELSQKNIHYYKFESNVGSSAANNYGIRASVGEFVLILNADVFLEKEYIQNSVEAFKRDATIGTVTGKLLSDSDHTIIDTTGVILYKEGVGDERGMGEMDQGQYDTDDYVVGACCAAAMYKREMLEDIKYENEYYDEDYFAFVEDLDISVLSTLLGWKTLYAYRAVGYHVRGGSTSSMSDFVQYLNIRNSELLYRKLLSGSPLIVFYHTLLKMIRLVTISSEMQKKIKEDLSKKREKFELKKRYYSRIDYDNLKPYLKKSYIFKRLNPLQKK
jgi:GT2 family glycosyltransferase